VEKLTFNNLDLRYKELGYSFNNKYNKKRIKSIFDVYSVNNLVNYHYFIK